MIIILLAASYIMEWAIVFILYKLQFFKIAPHQETGE